MTAAEGQAELVQRKGRQLERLRSSATRTSKVQNMMHLIAKRTGLKAMSMGPSVEVPNYLGFASWFHVTFESRPGEDGRAPLWACPCDHGGTTRSIRFGRLLQRPHDQKDPTKDSFWNTPSVGPQKCRILTFMRSLGPPPPPLGGSLQLGSEQRPQSQGRDGRNAPAGRRRTMQHPAEHVAC